MWSDMSGHAQSALKKQIAISERVEVLHWFLHVVRHSWKLQFDHLGAASKAILKPVYRFGIPNSDPQTLKSVKINSCRNIQMTVLSYSECKIVKIFRNSILHATGEDLQRQPRFPRCLTVFHLATFVEKPPPQKNCWIR